MIALSLVLLQYENYCTVDRCTIYCLSRCVYSKQTVFAVQANETFSVVTVSLKSEILDASAFVLQCDSH